MKRNLLLVPVTFFSLFFALTSTSRADSQHHGFSNYNLFHTGDQYSRDYRHGPSNPPNRLPEPDTLSLIGIGLAGMAWSLRKKRSKVNSASGS